MTNNRTTERVSEGTETQKMTEEKKEKKKNSRDGWETR